MLSFCQNKKSKLTERFTISDSHPRRTAEEVGVGFEGVGVGHTGNVVDDEGKEIVLTISLFHIHMKDATYLLGRGRVGIVYPLQVEFHQLLDDIEADYLYLNHAFKAVYLLDRKTTHRLVFFSIRGMLHLAIAEAA